MRPQPPRLGVAGEGAVVAGAHVLGAALPVAPIQLQRLQEQALLGVRPAARLLPLLACGAAAGGKARGEQEQGRAGAG